MNNKSFGLVQVFWGNGKGKTTAALGTSLRALGRGNTVHLVQMMKAGIEGTGEFEEYGELLALKRFENFSFERFGFREWIIGKPKPEHIEQAKNALKAAQKAAEKGKFDVVVVDECLYGVQLGVLTEDEIVGLIKSKHANTELILTGSHKPLEKIFALADLVTEVRKIKHPFDKGIPARKGIEY